MLPGTLFVPSILANQQYKALLPCSDSFPVKETGNASNSHSNCNAGTYRPFTDQGVKRMQVVLDNRGTYFEEVESTCVGAELGQHIQVTKSAKNFTIPYPMSKVPPLNFDFQLTSM
jgi:hypothetical protein